MIKWDKNLKKAPQSGTFLLKVNNGLFSGGWDWHKAIRIRDKFFNIETKEEISDPHSWANVNL